MRTNMKMRKNIKILLQAKLSESLCYTMSIVEGELSFWTIFYQIPKWLIGKPCIEKWKCSFRNYIFPVWQAKNWHLRVILWLNIHDVPSYRLSLSCTISLHTDFHFWLQWIWILIGVLRRGSGNFFKSYIFKSVSSNKKMMSVTAFRAMFSLNLFIEEMCQVQPIYKNISIWRLLITAAVKAFEIINIISDMKLLELCKRIFMTWIICSLLKVKSVLYGCWSLWSLL